MNLALWVQSWVLHSNNYHISLLYSSSICLMNCPWIGLHLPLSSLLLKLTLANCLLFFFLSIVQVLYSQRWHIILWWAALCSLATFALRCIAWWLFIIFLTTDTEQVFMALSTFPALSSILSIAFNHFTYSFLILSCIWWYLVISPISPGICISFHWCLWCCSHLKVAYFWSLIFAFLYVD